jgi:hypothetical protein
MNSKSMAKINGQAGKTMAQLEPGDSVGFLGYADML